MRAISLKLKGSAKQFHYLMVKFKCLHLILNIFHEKASLMFLKIQKHSKYSIDF